MTNDKLWSKNFILIMAVNLLLFCGFQMFPSALPPYVKSLGASDQVLGWLTGLATISALIVRPLSGFALDRYGRKSIFFLGLVLMVLATASYLFFPSVAVILVIRLIHGVGWGVASTASSTVATDQISKAHFAEGMGYFSLSSSLAIAVAPALALSLPSRTVFLTASGFVLLALVLSLLIGYAAIPGDRTLRLRQVALFEKASYLPSGMMLIVGLTYGGLVTFLALHAASRGIANIGVFFTVYALSMLLTRPYLGRLIDRHGYAAGIWPGTVLTTVALLVLAFAPTLAYFIVAAVLFGLGYGAFHTSLQAMAISQALPERRGAANATFFTGFDGGIGIGAVISGWLAAAFGYAWMYVWLAACPLLAGVIYGVYRYRANRSACR